MFGHGIKAWICVWFLWFPRFPFVYSICLFDRAAAADRAKRTGSLCPKISRFLVIFLSGCESVCSSVSSASVRVVTG